MKRTLPLILFILLVLIGDIGNTAGQTLTTLLNFSGGASGRGPDGVLVQGSDGNFYGTTGGGGTNNSGTLFRITSAGTLTTLYQFGSGASSGISPYAGLVQGSDGFFYGTTGGGGTNNNGTVYRISSAGTFTTLWQFSGGSPSSDGAGPNAGLVQGSDGFFYGTTGGGGTSNLNCGTYGCGTVFRISSAGTLTTLYQFGGLATDGAIPYGWLVQGSDGNFYGTTSVGGTNNGGTVFRISSAGTLTTLYQFGGLPTDGATLYSGLVQGGDGNFYGTTEQGGTSTNCIFGCGTVFRITPTGTLTTLFSFTGSASNGRYVFAGLVQGSDGNFYGSTINGGTSTNCIFGCGTVFRITPAGTLTTLTQFSGTNGKYPYGGAIQGSDGNFYGTTEQGGTSTNCPGGGCGTVFRMSPSYRINAWIRTTSSKWELGNSNWSLGVAPSITDSVDQVANASTKTVTIDGITVLSNSINGCLTISNLIVSAPVGSTNTLSLNNAGLVTPLDILNSFTISANGIVVVTNSKLRVNSVLPADSFNIDGTVSVRDDGLVVATNNSTSVGYGAAGRMTVSNGTWLARDVYVGYTNSSQGTLTVAGGTNTLSDFFGIGYGANATGRVWLTGGQLIKTNFTGARTAIGYLGVGQLTVSNGTWLGQGGDVNVAYATGSHGTLTVAGGTSVLASAGYGMSVGDFPNATGSVWVTGGELIVTNGNAVTRIGANGVGEMAISNGTWLALNVILGGNAAARGTLTVAGGTSVLSNLTIGSSGNSTGAVWMSGGQITTTNGVTTIGSSGIGQMTVSNGTVLSNGGTIGNLSGSRGTLTIAGGTTSFSQEFILGRIANASGTVWVTGGQLIVTNDNAATDIGLAGVGRMTVSNGTTLLRSVYVGFSTGSSGTLTIAGGTNQLSSVLYVGRVLGATGAVWVTGGQLVVTNDEMGVGNDGIGKMTVSNGTVLAVSVNVGPTNGAVGTLTVSGGSLMAANLGSTGFIDVRRGSMTINGGAVTVDQLFVTNGATGGFNLNAGTLNTKSTTITNDSVMAVGDGASAATLHLLGGVHSFANNLRIRTSALLTGCGTITGNVLADAGSTVIADCGTTLNFISGTFTNNGTMFATGGTVLKFYGPVVNNGLIDATGGNVQFLSTLSDNGTILTATNSWTDGSSKWETAANWSAGLAPTNTQAANLITNAGNKTVTIDGTTSGSFSSTMTIRNLNIAGAGTSTNTLSLNNAIGTPLHVRNDLNLSNNSATVINNSALQVDGTLSVGVTPGNVNRLTVTNNGELVSGFAVIGGFQSSNNSVLVTGPGSTWVNTNSPLSMQNSGPGAALVIADGARFIGAGVFIGDSAPADGNVVIVTDPGSSWSNTFTLSVGGANQDAQFVISNGASVYTANAIVGSPSGHNHSALITGSNSLWKTDGSVAVGIGGYGDSLTIADGGSLIASNASHTAEVVVDAATLFIGDGLFQVDNLVLTNGGVIQYTQSYRVDNSIVSVASGTVEAGSNLVVASTGGSTGTVNVTGGQLVVTNGALSIGNNGTITSGGGVGLMTVSNGSVLASNIFIGSSAGGQGDLTLANGGSISCPGGTNCLILINSLGFDQIGGDLVWAGSTLECGVTRSADYNISGGVATFQDLYIGYSNLGTMTMAGGVANISSRLTVGHLGSPVSTGVVWITGGQLTALNNYSIIGNSGVGQMTISNGVVTVADVFIGNSGNPGTLTLAGGTLTLNSLVLPNPGSRFIFSGGWLNALAVSNANGQILVVGNGVAPPTLNLLGNISLFDKGLSIAANATLTGFGTISGNVANSGLIMPGDGILTFTGIVTNNGLIVTNSALKFIGGLVNNGTILDAAADADGDGMNNLSEVLAGTNPGNSASIFHISAVTKVGNDLQVNWSTVGGKRYVVQASTASDGYTNYFTDLSSVVSVPGIGESSTSYLDLGTATSNPARYYRVRLVP